MSVDPQSSSAARSLSAADLLELQRLSNRYWARADHVTEFAIADMFTPDAVFMLGGLTLNGRRAIEDFFRERDASMSDEQRVTRHVATNFVATREGDGTVRVRSTVLVFSGNGVLPLPTTAPTGIADVDDTCVLTAEGDWKYARRQIRSVFVGEDAPAFARGKA
jgi:hypothetical protein